MMTHKMFYLHCKENIPGDFESTVLLKDLLEGVSSIAFIIIAHEYAQ